MPATRYSVPGLARSTPARPESMVSGPVRRKCLRPGGIWLAASRLLVAASLLLALAGTAQANTSQTCLRRCLATCAEQGRAADEACLRPCLRDCPVHCGTVDEDCALGCVKDPGELANVPAKDPAKDSTKDPAKSRAQDPVEDWLTGRATDRPDLAARCSEACTVKPVCRSSAYDSGPAKLTPAAPHLKPRDQ